MNGFASRSDSTKHMKGSFTADQYRRGAIDPNIGIDEVFLRVSDDVGGVVGEGEMFLEVWDVCKDLVGDKVELVFARNRLVPKDTLLYYR